MKNAVIIRKVVLTMQELKKYEVMKKLVDRMGIKMLLYVSYNAQDIRLAIDQSFMKTKSTSVKKRDSSEFLSRIKAPPKWCFCLKIFKIF